MGLAGLSVAWRLASQAFGVSASISNGIAVVAGACFILLCFAYGAKVLTAFDAVRAEFHHPVAGNLFATIPSNFLLLPILLAPSAPLEARIMWCAGAITMIGFAWFMIDRWMGDRQRVEEATPAWIVPVLGVLDIPLAAPSLDLPQAQSLMFACTAIGLFFAIPLFTMIFSRLLFEAAMPEALRPMTLILVAPFAVGFSAYVATTGRVDRFAEGLYGLMLFLLVILLGRLRNLRRCCPFRVAWWAVSFPLAASAGAATKFTMVESGIVTNVVAVASLTLASIVIAVLIARTVLGILRGELRKLST